MRAAGGRLEHLRHWALWSGLACIALAFGLGPVVAGFLGPFCLGLVFVFGHELSRPVCKDESWERFAAFAVKGAGFAFVPLLALTWFLDNKTSEVTVGRATGGDEYWVYPMVALYLSVVTIVYAAFVILRWRAPAGWLKMHLKTCWLLIPGAVILVAGSGLFWFVSPVLLGTPPALFLGHALYRIGWPRGPERHRTDAPPPLPAAPPVFTPFGGR